MGDLYHTHGFGGQGHLAILRGFHTMVLQQHYCSTITVSCRGLKTELNLGYHSSPTQRNTAAVTGHNISSTKARRNGNEHHKITHAQ